jgi:hypothetical protein
MQQRRWALAVVVTCAFALSGCGDDDAAAAASDGGAGHAAASGGGGVGHAGSSGAGRGGASGTRGGGQSGSAATIQTAQVRVVDLVPDVTFDAWGRGPDNKARRIAQGIEYETVSDYIDVPLDMLTMTPVFVLWRAGDAPPADALFGSLLDDSYERVRIEVLELDGPDQRATIILEPAEPKDATQLEYETLDETEANRGSASQLNLHVAYHLFDIGGGVVPSTAISGMDCLFRGSTSVADVFSVAPGAFDLAVYDLQTGVGCSQTDPLGMIHLEGAAGDDLLVVEYLDGEDVRLLSAEIAAP